MSYEKPNFTQDRPEQETSELGESAFRVGRDIVTEEIYKGGMRLFKWLPMETGQDASKSLASLAGWDQFPHGTGEDGIDFIELPAGTRNATSVLSGMEAWEGEKAEILEFVANYEREVLKEFNKFDLSVGFDTVGVTKERKMFIAPPNDLSDDPETMTEWVRGSVLDLNNILLADPNRMKLITLYLRGLNDILYQGR
jgi:hypothetical protein